MKLGSDVHVVVIVYIYCNLVYPYLES